MRAHSAKSFLQRREEVVKNIKNFFFMTYFIRLSSVTVETVKVMKALWQDGWGMCITTNGLL